METMVILTVTTLPMECMVIHVLTVTWTVCEYVCQENKNNSSQFHVRNLRDENQQNLK